MNQVLTACPVCSSELMITQLACPTCNTGIDGEFTLGRLGRLSREQLQYVELLAQYRGNINHVASALNVSYTTARTRMDEIAATLGAPMIPPTTVDRGLVLRQLETGAISAEEALRLLQS